MIERRRRRSGIERWRRNWIVRRKYRRIKEETERDREGKGENK